jgi:MarR family transcriptional regulator for hemolysin
MSSKRLAPPARTVAKTPSKRSNGAAAPQRDVAAGVLFAYLPLPDRDDVMLGFLIHDLARTRRRAGDLFMKPFGLTRAQWYLLSRLSLNDGMTQTALADAIEISKANLGLVVESLEAGGWVQRRESPGDLRVKRVFLTRTAAALMKRMFEREVEFNNLTLIELSRSQRDQLYRLLTKAKIGVDRMQSQGGRGY